MIFSRVSHTLMFVGGILLLVAFVADERGALGSVASEGAGNLAAAEQAEQAAQRQAAVQGAANAAPVVVEEVDGWTDEPEVGAPPSMQNMGQDMAMDDDTAYDMSDDILDPSAEALDPVPDLGEDW